jgi:membrane protein DedA with SNARE-associated domain
VEAFTHFFLSIVDHLGYRGLFFVMAVGNMGIPVGTELVVTAAGALAATGHLSSVWLTGLVATLGEVAGGTILYAIGYVGGEPFVARYGRYIKVDAKKLATFHTFYARHGNATVFVCRLLPVVRGVAALPAGVSRMPRRVFVAYTAAGSAVFCFGLAYVGSLFGKHFDEIAPYIHRFSALAVGLVVVAIAAGVVTRVVRARRAARGGA